MLTSFWIRWVRVAVRLALPASLAWFALPTPAQAETSAQRRAAAEVLFKEAGELYKASQFEAACQKLEKSQELDPATGTLLNLARCFEKIGKTASAWLAYVDAAARAKADGQSDRERMAREAAKRLDPLVPKLTLAVEDAKNPDLEVRRNGETVPQTLWNVGAPVDPGKHEVEVTAPGKKPWTKTIEIEAEQERTVQVPALEIDPNAPVQRPGGEAPGDALSPSEREQGLGTRKTVALVGAGAGVASLIVGTIYGLGAKSDRDRANELCDSTCPTNAGYRRNEDARRKGNMATIFVGVGGALVAASAVVWLTAPSDAATENQPSDSAKLNLGTSLGGDGARIFLGGVW